MDIISPIVIRKLNFCDEKSQKAAAADLQSEQETRKSKAFFDNISNYFIKIYKEECIQIYNKHGNSLKKNLNIKLNVDRVNCCAIEKELKHLLIQFDNKMILIINLINEKVCDILHFDFTNLIGMSFMRNSGGAAANAVNSRPGADKNESVFFLLFPNKINFFKVSGVPNENVREIKMVKHSSLVTNALFNLRYEVLVLEKGDKNYELYNLSHEKFYNKAHMFNISNKKSKEGSGFSRLFGMFSSSEADGNQSKLSIQKNNYFPFNFLKFPQIKSQQGNTGTNLEKIALFKKTQIFLEIIYKKLYFIVLNYEESEIQIYKVENLNKLRKVKEISFDNTQMCTLQFIDNLILFHNFERCDTITIDLKSDSNDIVIFKNFPMSNKEILEANKEKLSELIQVKVEIDENGDSQTRFEYNYIETISMLSYLNRNICNRRKKSLLLFNYNDKILSFKSNVIFDNENNEFYSISFSPLLFYENSFVKFEAIFSLLRRKHSKEVILNSIYELIKNNYSIKIIKLIFEKIAKLIHKVFLPLKSNNTLTNYRNTISFGEKVEELKNSYDLAVPKTYLMNRRYVIKQPDIYYNLFEYFLSRKNTNYEYVLKVLVYFVNSIQGTGLSIQASYEIISNKLIKKCSNFTLISILLQYHALQDNYELAKYLINHEDPGKQNSFQLGLDMFIRLNKYEDVFLALIGKNMVREALIFIKKYRVVIEALSPETIMLLRKVSIENKNLLIDYMYK